MVVVRCDVMINFARVALRSGGGDDESRGRDPIMRRDPIYSSPRWWIGSRGLQDCVIACLRVSSDASPPHPLFLPLCSLGSSISASFSGLLSQCFLLILLPFD